MTFCCFFVSLSAKEMEVMAKTTKILSDMKRDEVKLTILNSVLAAEVAKGHLKWKVSEIARAAKVSRPLIYYYFGTTKKEILTECLAVIAKEYFGLSESRENMLKAGEVAESLKQTRAMFRKNPALVVFYQKWRMQDSPIGKQLEEIEVRYQKKLKACYPHLSAVQVMILHAIFHGLITAPFLTNEGLKEAVLVLNQILNLRVKK